MQDLDWRDFRSGGQGGNRTPDTRIFSPLLYQLSYLASREIASIVVCFSKTTEARGMEHFEFSKLP